MHNAGSLSGEMQGFLDYCRIEKGLAGNSLDAYQRDLRRFFTFCQERGCGEAADAEGLGQYLDSLYRAGLASRSIARHLTTLRSYYTFMLRQGIIQSDPTANLTMPKQWSTLPKYLTLEQIDHLAGAPEESKPTGVRDRAMVEVLYAAGLRVSELCQLELSDLNLELGVLRVTGKGGRQRLVPVGKSALAAVSRYLESSRPSLLRGRGSRYLFVTSRGGRLTRQDGQVELPVLRRFYDTTRAVAGQR